jgi:hypothetical protein
VTRPTRILVWVLVAIGVLLLSPIVFYIITLVMGPGVLR